MALPTSRAEFKEWCLRQLGKPVININVSEEQVDDRVSEALQWWYDYHYEGTEKTYYKYQLTQDDFTNKYITLPDNIIGAVRIFELGSAINSSSMFNVQYQIMMSDLYNISSVSMVPYYMVMQHIALLNELLVGQQPIRYNRYNNKLYIDMDWNRVLPGQWVVVEAYSIMDPATYTEVWSDRWLQRYAIALIKQQWGNNLKKFQGMAMPGGITFNGQQIYDEASAEIAAIEKEVIGSYSLPVTHFIG